MMQLRTWPGLRVIDQNKLLSAFNAISSEDEGHPLVSINPIEVAPPCAPACLDHGRGKPNTAREAYSREAMVVMQATSYSCAGWRRLWVLSMQRACIEDAQLGMSSSKWPRPSRKEQF